MKLSAGVPPTGLDEHWGLSGEEHEDVQRPHDGRRARADASSEILGPIHGR